LRAHLGWGVVAEDAELSAIDGDVVELAPFGGELDGVLDAEGVPAGEAVLVEEELAA